MLGEARRFHPLVGFGLLAHKLESLCHKRLPRAIFKQRVSGVLAVLLLVLPPVILAWFVSSLGFLINILILYLAIGCKSLQQHAQYVRYALQQAAQNYYGMDKLLAVAGSQAAIPQLFKPCRVGVLTPSYNEHAHAWKKSGHRLFSLAATDIDAAVNQLLVLVLVNPNNPSAEVFSTERILEWHARLSSRGGAGWFCIC